MTTTSASYRELDHRTADGLAVTLEWDPMTDALRAEDASDSFVHPLVCAGRAVCEVSR